MSQEVKNVKDNVATSVLNVCVLGKIFSKQKLCVGANWVMLRLHTICGVHIRGCVVTVTSAWVFIDYVLLPIKPS